MKTLEVDAEKSLGYKANGRLKPADKKDYANYDAKTYICPRCHKEYLMETASFGENILCRDCEEPLMEKF
jgi:transcription initiation factor IIE alpha subunit